MNMTQIVDQNIDKGDWVMLTIRLVHFFVQLLF
jgi:hypothetical protein